jgi:hypothetical protein
MKPYDHGSQEHHIASGNSNGNRWHPVTGKRIKSGNRHHVPLCRCCVFDHRNDIAEKIAAKSLFVRSGFKNLDRNIPAIKKSFPVNRTTNLRNDGGG